MNDPLERIAQELDSEDPEIKEKEDPVIEEEDNHGHLNYDQWVKEGRDPEMYKGKKAFDSEYNRIQEVKSLKSELKTMSSTLKDTVDVVSRREQQAEERHRKELEKALEKAREDGDIDQAVSITEELSKPVERVESKQPTNPVIDDFIATNSVLESDEVMGEFSRIYNGKLKNDGVTPTDVISDAAIKGYLRSAMDSVKSLYPDKFRSSKLDRGGTTRPKAKTQEGKINIESSLRDYKITDAIGERNGDAAIGMYNMLKEINPKSAEQFAKKILENE